MADSHTLKQVVPEAPMVYYRGCSLKNVLVRANDWSVEFTLFIRVLCCTLSLLSVHWWWPSSRNRSETVINTSTTHRYYWELLAWSSLPPSIIGKDRQKVKGAECMLRCSNCSSAFPYAACMQLCTLNRFLEEVKLQSLLTDSDTFDSWHTDCKLRFACGTWPTTTITS